jgi:ribonuclease BN (tRNA processing enzyme)
MQARASRFPVTSMRRACPPYAASPSLDPPGSPAILYTLHTPPHAIGQLAKEVSAGTLLLSHISPAVDESQRAVLDAIGRNYVGSVAFAKDGMRVRP